MLNNMVAFIPARAGSKRIKDKNIALFCGKPLIYWILKACEKSIYIKKIYISTDSFKFIEIIRSLNIIKPIYFCKRSNCNSLDISSTEDCLIEFLKSNESKKVKDIILLQCTSPLISNKNLDNSIKLYYNEKKDVISIVKLNRYIWKKDSDEYSPENYKIDNRLRTQDQNFRSIYIENGAFYISNKEKILDSKQRISGKINAYIMDEKHFLEVDTMEDFKALEAIKNYELHR